MDSRLSHAVRNVNHEVMFDLDATGSRTPLQLPLEVTIIQRWYARTNVPEIDDLKAWAQSSKVSCWDTGTDRAVWSLSLAELLERRPSDQSSLRRPCDPWPWVAMPWTMLLVDKEDLEPRNTVRSTLIPPRCWICFEGLQVSDPRLVDDVIKLLCRHRATKRSAQEEIIDYITGIAKDTKEPMERAILEVVADGIRQHKEML